MLQLSIVLLVIGVLAILLEMLMPGADAFIAGIIGILALAASAVLAVIYVPGGWFIVGVNLTFLALSLVFFFTYIRKKQMQGHIILGEVLDEDIPHIDLSALVGMEGKTVTALRPSGEADFGGLRVEVTADGIVERGTRVRVIETHANKVIVRVVNGN